MESRHLRDRPTAPVARRPLRGTSAAGSSAPASERINHELAFP